MAIDKPSTRENTGGGERTRTADFHVANVALYQLSYTPGITGSESKEDFFRRVPSKSGLGLRLAELRQLLPAMCQAHPQPTR